MKIEKDEIEKAEEHIILLLGSEERPIRELFLQKELFILSLINSSLKNIFEFKKHYNGPFSEVIHESLDCPAYFEDSFVKIGESITLNEEGLKNFKKLSETREHKKILPIIRFLRKTYEKLDYQELLFLIYATYPEYMEKSNISDYLFNPKMKERIIKDLLSKKVITDERYLELKNE